MGDRVAALGGFQIGCPNAHGAFRLQRRALAKLSGIHRSTICQCKTANGGSGQTQDEVALPVTGYGAVLNCGGTLADENLRRHEGLATTSLSRLKIAQRPSRAQVGGELTSKGTAPLHVQRLVDRFVADAHCRFIREVDRRAMSDWFRTPRTRPPSMLSSFVAPLLPGYRWAGDGLARQSSNLASQTALDIAPWVALVASLAHLGRRTARSACHCAVIARHEKHPPRVAALRRNSREIVDAQRSSRRAISRTPWPWARSRAICSRSVNDKHRPVAGGDDSERCDGGIPPHSRNHLVPTACDTPATRASSSLERSLVMAAQTVAVPPNAQREGVPETSSSHGRSEPSLSRSQPPNVKCCDDRLNSPSTPRSPSATAAGRWAFGLPWAVSGKPMTTPWQRASSRAWSAS